jgi:hypothetical protein
MDPLFERRELSKKIHINSKFLQANIQGSILQQLKSNYEGICSSEGFIQPQSITILEWSMGRCNYKIGGVDYVVKFQADICLPHQGQKFKAQVSLKSKMGIHSETLPIKILIPRDLHIGNEDFENLLNHLKDQTASGVYLCLAELDGDLIELAVKFFTQMIVNGSQADLVQTWLAVYLKLHSDDLIGVQGVKELADILKRKDDRITALGNKVLCFSKVLGAVQLLG